VNFRIADRTLACDFKNAFKIAEKYHAEALCAEAISYDFTKSENWRCFLIDVRTFFEENPPSAFSFLKRNGNGSSRAKIPSPQPPSFLPVCLAEFIPQTASLLCGAPKTFRRTDGRTIFQQLVLFFAKVYQK